MHLSKKYNSSSKQSLWNARWVKVLQCFVQEQTLPLAAFQLAAVHKNFLYTTYYNLFLLHNLCEERFTSSPCGRLLSLSISGNEAATSSHQLIFGILMSLKGKH